MERGSEFVVVLCGGDAVLWVCLGVSKGIGMRLGDRFVDTLSRPGT